MHACFGVKYKTQYQIKVLQRKAVKALNTNNFVVPQTQVLKSMATRQTLNICNFIV